MPSPTKFLFACLLLALAACRDAPEPPQAMNLPLQPLAFACVLPNAPPASGPARDAFCQDQRLQADACTASDGEWGVAGLSYPGTLPSCNLPTPDAGRVCTTNRQCRQSACQPDAGAEQAPPGQATGHCDKYGHLYPHCDPTVVLGSVRRPAPCPLY